MAVVRFVCFILIELNSIVFFFVFIADAVCCSDHLHCSPNGYACDVEHNKCQRGILIPWFKKKPALPINKSLTKITLSTIQCPGEFVFIFFYRLKKFFSILR